MLVWRVMDIQKVVCIHNGCDSRTMVGVKLQDKLLCGRRGNWEAMGSKKHFSHFFYIFGILLLDNNLLSLWWHIIISSERNLPIFKRIKSKGSRRKRGEMVLSGLHLRIRATKVVHGCRYTEGRKGKKRTRIRMNNTHPSFLFRGAWRLGFFFGEPSISIFRMKT